MAGYKGQIQSKAIERHYPHIVELVVPLACASHMIEGIVVVGTRNNYLPNIRGKGTHDALQHPALARLIKAAPASPSRSKGSLSFVSKIAARAGLKPSMLGPRFGDRFGDHSNHSNIAERMPDRGRIPHSQSVLFDDGDCPAKPRGIEGRPLKRYNSSADLSQRFGLSPPTFRE